MYGAVSNALFYYLLLLCIHLALWSVTSRVKCLWSHMCDRDIVSLIIWYLIIFYDDFV